MPGPHVAKKVSNMCTHRTPRCHMHIHRGTRQTKRQKKGASSPFLHGNMPELFMSALTGSKIWPRGILSQAAWNKRTWWFHRV